jgi:hypothetical protein
MTPCVRFRFEKITPFPYLFFGISRNATPLLSLLRYFIEGECDTIKIYCDSKGALSEIHNPVLEDLREHIEVSLHHARERQEAGYVDFKWVSGVENVADMFTKALPLPAFQKHRDSLRLFTASQ